jgi:hypothetical protein
MLASTILPVLPQLRERGLSVAGYIPDSSLLVVGTHAAAEEAEAWPGIVWVVSVQRKGQLASHCCACCLGNLEPPAASPSY